MALNRGPEQWKKSSSWKQPWNQQSTGKGRGKGKGKAKGKGQGRHEFTRLVQQSVKIAVDQIMRGKSKSKGKGKGELKTFFDTLKGFFDIKKTVIP